MTEHDETKRPNSAQQPTDAFAAATALGVAMASSAMQFWFGVASGLARAGQDALDRADRQRGDVSALKVSEATPVAPSGPEPAKPVADVVPLKPKAVAEAVTRTAEVLAPSPRAVAEPAAPRPSVTGATGKASAGAPKSASLKKPKKRAPAAAVKPVATNAIMPEDFRAPRSMAKPDAPDDLKQLPGVGPKLEQVLNGLGIWTYGQVAAWTPEEIAYVEDMTGLAGRIAADRWLEQAAGLATGATRH